MKQILLLFTLLVLIGTSNAFGQNEINKVECDAEVIDNSDLVLKRKVAIGRFSNETQYGKGAFYDRDNDPMGKQAQDLLVAKLASTNKFLLLERDDFSLLEAEAALSGGDSSSKVGADYMIIGSITEFGRNTTGRSNLFSKRKTQKVEAAVSIRIVDVYSGLIIYSDESSGIAELSTRTTMGFGGRAGFDATLSDKAISSAIDKMVENIIIKCTDKPWRSYFLSYDRDDEIFIAGGESQGLTVGAHFAVMQKGKNIRNPQTGISVELPGKVVGTIAVEQLLGDTPETEFSRVSYSGQSLDITRLSDYYIEEPVK